MSDVTDRLKDTEGGHNCAWWFDKDRKEALVECEECGEIQLKHKGREDIQSRYRLTFIEDSAEDEISNRFEGYFCSIECLTRFARSVDSEVDQDV